MVAFNKALAFSAVSQLYLNASAAAVSKRAPSGVPSYALDYAPLVYLYSGDPYRPSDLGAQLTNTQPENNYVVDTAVPSPLTLDNLNQVNGSDYLTSIDYIDVDGSMPAWTLGVTPNSAGQTVGAVSCAIIVNEHDSLNVDVFYMYFYAFNWGGYFLDVNLDDHVGDWEHTMVRFYNGVPTAVWFSQHQNGEAFSYDTVQKSGLRPIVFSANGSHANYAITGTHDHTIPDLNLDNGLLVDYTNQGPLWDPTLSAYYYTYDANTASFAAYDTTTPVNWLYWTGAWGDERYPTSDTRQVNFLDLGIEYKYTSGPTGPEDKQLNRTNVCPDNGYVCVIRTALGP
ncbi:hypothetical protein MBLNU459_g6625t1 [Dothideomycetes sp. NU459]